MTVTSLTPSFIARLQRGAQTAVADSGLGAPLLSRGKEVVV